MHCQYFFDLPVYRLTSDKYYELRDAFVENDLFPPNSPSLGYLRQRDKSDPRKNDAFRDHLQRKYGGCWEFNEIIGYVRLHFLGSQIRGEYFSVSKKRIVRTRTKTFEFRTWKLAPEIDIERPHGRSEVLSAISQYIKACKRELPKRYIDTSIFDLLAPHIDWEALYRGHV